MIEQESPPDRVNQSHLKTGLRLTIPLKFALITASLTTIVVLSFWLSVRQQLGPTLQRQADQLGEILVSQTAESITELVLANDLLSLNVVLNQLTGNDAISHVAVFNVDNQLIASAGNSPQTGTPANTVYDARIALQDSIAGTVRLSLNPELLDSGLSRYRLYFWIILTLGLALSTSAALALAGHITRPIRQISNWLNDPLEADLVYDNTRQDEFGVLLADSASLVSELQKENPALMLFDDTSDSTEEGETERRVQATSLTIRVNNIEKALELLHPNTLSRLLEEFRQLAEQAAKPYNGKIYQYTGNSLYLVFQNKEDVDHAFNAICCAQLFSLLMQKMNSIHRENGSPALKYCQGLHSGDLFQSGNAESCTFIGSSISVSSKLSMICKPDQILISPTTHSLAEGDELFEHLEKMDLEPEADIEFNFAYILEDEMGGYAELIHRQADRILQT